ncbi:hypothetical protein L2Y94_05560 [Luteibacter aegosomatis]|uniref:hypothetical protein n=1 Tax=Luteibacter aegosomatis TaxID=2911537 RepID=UPI001FFB9C29|nr:hypothetical protein [Luteibacter aegosomatis]UPG86821.1 hypothetical protein L2Y94_05560 [Luteibacter aegosomatis]
MSTETQKVDAVRSLRYLIATELLLARHAIRRARRHEFRASTGLSENPQAALKVAAGYKRDAAGSRSAVARLRADLARVGGAA